MKTANENFEAFVLPLDQLYSISGGNDGGGECDPVKCDAYDAGRWFGEFLTIGLQVLKAIG